MLEKKILTQADQIITVSKEVGKLLINKITNQKKDVAVIPNGYDEADFPTISTKTSKELTITYTGTIAMGYRIDQFVKAISLLPDSLKKTIKIRFVGNVPDEILDLFRLKNLDKMVEVLGYIPHDQAIQQMVNASMLLLAIPDSPDNKGIVTGKFFEYLASKRPILAIGPRAGDVDKMLQKCKAGRLFAYDETEMMHQYPLEILEQVQKGSFRSETIDTEKYTRKNLTAELTKYL
jgi:glycosyltransferase involved in cell wall biosynthesis